MKKKIALYIFVLLCMAFLTAWSFTSILENPVDRWLRAGNYFTASFTTTDVDSNETLYCAFTACTSGYANIVPVIFDIQTTVRGEFFLYEACTTVGKADTVDFTNLWRAATNTLPSELCPACSIVYRGTLVTRELLSPYHNNGQINNPNWLLTPGTDYLIAMLSYTADNRISCGVKIRRVD